MAEKLQFPRKVPAQGYRWVLAKSAAEPEKPPQPALVEADPAVQQSADTAPLAPLPHPALFLVFADVTPTKEGVLAFANRYGWLGLEQEIRKVTEDRQALSPSMRGEFLSDWRAQISAMRRLAGLWDMVRRQDREALARHIFWDAWSGLSVYFDSHPNGEGGAPSLGLVREKKMIAKEATDWDWLEQVQAGDVLAPAQRYLQVEMDQELRRSAEGVHVGMISDSRHPHPVLGYTCPTLLCALWMQFAAAVNDGRSFGKCRECGAFFEYSPAVARSHRRYCSTRCRTKAFRERQVRARQMHTAGKPFKEIAAELESDVATVRQWITGIKE